MATRSEARLGATSSLGTTYTSLGTVPADNFNLLLQVANRTGASANLRAYIAANSWTTGEPTGADLVAAIAYDMPIAAGAVVQISGYILDAGEKLIVHSSEAAALDVIASGVQIVL